jgi:DNA helicase II / ATP-dependent DNA helicase PcrA
MVLGLEKKFIETIYQKLNKAQRVAVDTLDGPVMVIAGPGTGKTQIIGSRIANILLQGSGINPQDILCITYTDAGVQAMRNRLIHFIGAEAYKVNIHTFHSFCSDVIRDYPEFFGNQQLKPADELAKRKIAEQIIYDLPPTNPLHTFTSDILHSAKQFLSFIDTCKKENWTAGEIETAYLVYANMLPTTEGYFYKQNRGTNKIGDPKINVIQKELAKYDKLREAIKLLPTYNEALANQKLYDFNDMLTWVLNAFETNDELLALLQPKYLYILVDEFQDTSGIQSQLLEHLINYDDSPNIFVVGDDDQSVYGFQGANLQNIENFMRKYQQTLTPVVLTQNYRSSQHILNAASSIIQYNKERLTLKLPQLNLNKNITADNDAYKNITTKPILHIYNNPLHEAAAIVKQIEDLHKNGLPLHEIAILYTRHNIASHIVNLLQKKGIAYNIKKAVNVLNEPITIQILDILKYLQQEPIAPHSAQQILFKILHFKHFYISANDIAHIAISLKNNDCKHKYWRNAIEDIDWLTQIGIKEPQKVIAVAAQLQNWLSEMQVLTLPMLLENIIYQSGLVQHILSKPENKLWHMQILNTLIEYLNNYCLENPTAQVKETLAHIDELKRYDIELPVYKMQAQASGVQLVTVYSAKGLEFNTVFLIGCDENQWKPSKGGNKGYSILPTLTLSNIEDEVETYRRLFFVGLTRAKENLHISYSLLNANEKEIQPSIYITELDEQPEMIEVVHEVLSDAVLESVFEVAFSPNAPVNIALIEHEFIQARLEKFSLSASTLDSYLTCPISFYYEKIISIPQATNDNMALGIAIHKTLDSWYKNMLANKDKIFAAEDFLIHHFENEMLLLKNSFTEKQFSNRLEQGKLMLGAYYKEAITNPHKNIITEYTINTHTKQGVPLTGKIDKLSIYNDYVEIIDFKTGRADTPKAIENMQLPKDKNIYGGAYWRQMIFYKLLLDCHPYEGKRMTKGSFVYLQQKDYTVPLVQKEVLPTTSDIEKLQEWIAEVYQNIQDHKFSTGCGKDDCTWCTFAKTHVLQINKQEINEA